MRLINTSTFRLESFVTNPPPYAILSHRWQDGEVTFQDLEDGSTAHRLRGYMKLRRAVDRARRDGFQYIWVDTCCIDKTSSTELSEVINSMFSYYKGAAICYAYLADVTAVGLSEKVEREDFGNSSWFKRGWTLQELIAPTAMRFFNGDWKSLGTKSDLAGDIQVITSIPENVLLGGDLSRLSACSKMAWAAQRQTTVPEDIAYCLLGIFDIHMPLIYGEGGERAFVRLQEEILKRSEDESLFLWKLPPEEARMQGFWGLLARSPSYFKQTPMEFRPCLPSVATSQPPVMTGRGLLTEMLLAPVGIQSWRSIYAALVNVEYGGAGYGLLMQRLSFRDSQFARIAPETILVMKEDLRPDYSALLQRFDAPDALFTAWRRLDHYCEPERFFVRQTPPSEQMWTNRIVGFILTPAHHVLHGIEVQDTCGRWTQRRDLVGSHAKYVLPLSREELQGGSPISWLGALLVERLASKVRYIIFVGQGGGTTALGTRIWPSHPVIASVAVPPSGEGSKEPLAPFLENNRVNSGKVQERLNAEGRMDDLFEPEDWRGLVYYSLKLGDHLGRFALKLTAIEDSDRNN